MRTPTACLLLGLLTASAHATAADAKVLAQFDIGFAKCETLFPHMRGHRDEAFLSLWKIKPDDKARAELAAARKGAKYREQRQAALKSMGAASGPEHEAKLKGQCQATWTETQRNKALVKP